MFEDYFAVKLGDHRRDDSQRFAFRCTPLGNTGTKGGGTDRIDQRTLSVRALFDHMHMIDPTYAFVMKDMITISQSAKLLWGRDGDQAICCRVRGERRS